MHDVRGRSEWTAAACNSASISKPTASCSPTASSMTASWWRMERCTEATQDSPDTKNVPGDSQHQYLTRTGARDSG